MDQIRTPLAIIAAIGAGLMAGIFLIFSNTIMRSLAKLAPTEGLTAMRSINVTIVNPLFLLIFMGTGVLCVVLVLLSLLKWSTPGSAVLLAGAAAYLLGSIIVTVFVNVPMNDALMAAQVGEPSSLEVWQDYLVRWTLWNHVRTGLSIISTALLIGSIWLRGA